MRLIVQPTLESIIAVNQIVCSEGGNPHQCLNSGKIESAISSAFYPGSYPFSHGGLAEIIEGCAASSVNQDELKDWFERHKVYLDV